jgi:hypothetical protein
MCIGFVASDDMKRANVLPRLPGGHENSRSHGLTLEYGTSRIRNRSVNDLTRTV